MIIAIGSQGQTTAPDCVREVRGFRFHAGLARPRPSAPWSVCRAASASIDSSVGPLGLFDDMSFGIGQ